MTTTDLRPGWGMSAVIPAAARAAWGARMIITTGHADMLPDRQGSDGTESAVMLLHERLNSGVLREARNAIEDLLESGIMRQDAQETFVLHDDGALVIVADANASYGYAYVTAWLV